LRKGESKLGKYYRKSMGEKFYQKACVPITKRHEFIGYILEDEQAHVVHVGMKIHLAAHVWISKFLIEQ
jgi:hypothetical protein